MQAYEYVHGREVNLVKRKSINAVGNIIPATSNVRRAWDEGKTVARTQIQLERKAYGAGDEIEREERSGSQAPGEERNVLAPPETAALVWLDTSTLVPVHGWDGTSG